MVEDDGNDQRNDLAEAQTFFIRLGANDDAPFALCERIGSVEGASPVPGTGKTVAQLVSEQALLAAAAPRGQRDDLPELLDDSATGVNLGGGQTGGN